MIALRGPAVTAGFMLLACCGLLNSCAPWEADVPILVQKYTNQTMMLVTDIPDEITVTTLSAARNSAPQPDRADIRDWRLNEIAAGAVREELGERFSISVLPQRVTLHDKPSKLGVQLLKQVSPWPKADLYLLIWASEQMARGNIKLVHANPGIGVMYRMNAFIDTPAYVQEPLMITLLDGVTLRTIATTMMQCPVHDVDGGENFATLYEVPMRNWDGTWKGIDRGDQAEIRERMQSITRECIAHTLSLMMLDQ